MLKGFDWAGQGDGDFPATIEIVEKLGAEFLVQFQNDASDVPLTMRISPDRRLHAGETVHVRLNRERLHIFGGDGKVLNPA